MLFDGKLVFTRFGFLDLILSISVSLINLLGFYSVCFDLLLGISLLIKLLSNSFCVEQQEEEENLTNLEKLGFGEFDWWVKSKLEVN